MTSKKKLKEFADMIILAGPEINNPIMRRDLGDRIKCGVSSADEFKTIERYASLTIWHTRAQEVATIVTGGFAIFDSIIDPNPSECTILFAGALVAAFYAGKINVKAKYQTYKLKTMMTELRRD
jgi:hypothetical protein